MSVQVSPAWGWLDAAAVRRLDRRLSEALRRARSSGGSALVSVTCSVDGSVDPTALVVASRRVGEPWFAFEQPDRDGSAVAAVGSVRGFDAAGSGRFGEVARAWAD